ncbi:hypothetical protein [Listeria booriae]|nr:hypothetical protein [Listeria booriae]
MQIATSEANPGDFPKVVQGFKATKARNMKFFCGVKFESLIVDLG